MKSFTFVFSVLLLGMMGCQSGRATWPQFAHGAPEPPHDWIAEMKSIARTHHMHYKIICAGEDDSNPTWNFVALVFEKPTDTVDLDDQQWTGGNGATQADAAHSLVGEFSRKGFHKPRLEKKPTRGRGGMHKQCPPEIRGDEYAEAK